MSNPLLSQMNGMAAPGGSPGGMNILQLMSMFRGKNPAAIMQLMAQKNPQFAEFARHCQGKTMEQVAQEYGIDLSQLRGLMK